jgi:hypothetical protein
MIGNWTVITQPVKYKTKGLFLRERYLTSKKHPNHKNTENIINLYGDKNTTKRIALMGENFNLKRIMANSRGRRVESYAMEFCLTLPKGYRPEVKSWKKIINDICLKTRTYCNLTPEEFKNFTRCIRAVVHQQDQKIKTGTGDHVHLIIPKIVFDSDLRILKELQKKQYTKFLKTIYTSSIFTHLKYDIADYSPKEINNGQKLEIWKANKIALNKENSDKKRFIQITNQIQKWLLAFDKRDEKQMKRQFNRIKKSYVEMIGDNAKYSINSVANSIAKIERLSGNKLI